MSCQDQVKDRLPVNATEEDIIKFQPQMETCVIKCADEHIALIPSMMKRMKEVLRK